MAQLPVRTQAGGVCIEEFTMKRNTHATEQSIKITLDNLAPMGANPHKYNLHPATAIGGHFYRANTEDISKES